MKRGVLLLALGAAVASAVAAAAFVGAVGPQRAAASSHREAPLIADDPAADNTDVYAFVSPDKPDTVTIIANYIPFEDPAGGPNYYRFDPTVRYEINVDNDGDAREDVTYQFRFSTHGRRTRTRSSTTPDRSRPPTDPNLNVKQTYSVTRIDGRWLDGPRIEPAGAAREHRAALEPELRPVPGRRRPRRRPQGLRRAARRPVLRRPRLDLRPRRPAAVQRGAPHSRSRTKAGEDGVRNYNMHTIAIQVPKTDLLRSPMADGTIGVYAQRVGRRSAS